MVGREPQLPVSFRTQEMEEPIVGRGIDTAEVQGAKITLKRQLDRIYRMDRIVGNLRLAGENQFTQ